MLRNTCALLGAASTCCPHYRYAETVAQHARLPYCLAKLGCGCRLSWPFMYSGAFSSQPVALPPDCPQFGAHGEQHTTTASDFLISTARLESVRPCLVGAGGGDGANCMPAVWRVALPGLSLRSEIVCKLQIVMKLSCECCDWFAPTINTAFCLCTVCFPCQLLLIR